MALHDNFIKYGTKAATSFVIIDIDKVKKKYLRDINLYKEHIYHKLNMKPNWITKTNKGYHIGFMLNEHVWLNNTNNTDKLIQIKKNLTNILDADIAGSHRLIGFWRNPLTHKSIINVEETFNIDDLYRNSIKQLINSFSLFDTEQINIQKIQNQNKDRKELIKVNLEKIEKTGFIEGNRNNYLFTKILSMLYSAQITNDQVEETLLKLNDNKLNTTEVMRIAKSILKYNIKPNARYSEIYKPGEYHQDLWDNQIHNYKKNNKIEFSRQKFGQKATTALIIKSTLDKLVQGYKVTYKNNELFTNENIVKNSKVSKSTVKRYRNQRLLEDEIRSIALMQYIAELGAGGRVKANEPPFRELLNLALSELNFEYKKTNKMFAFMVSEDDRLIFYEVEQGLTLYAA